MCYNSFIDIHDISCRIEKWRYKNMVDFNIRIKELMAYYNLSQTDLSNKTGISKSLISAYVQGIRNPKQDKIVILSQRFGVSINWLMGLDVPMFDNYTEERKSKAFQREMLYEKSLPQTEEIDFDFGYDDGENEILIETERRSSEERAINKLEKLTQITSALATMSDEDFEMVYKLAIRLSK